MQIDTTKCLDEIEGTEWEEPEFESHLVTTCHELRKKPIARFTTEDLRIMIGQGIGTEALVPQAIQRLREDPLVSGDLFEGDLLQSVSRVPFAYWLDHVDQYTEFQRLARVAIQHLKTEEYVAQGDHQLATELEAATSRTISGEQGEAPNRGSLS